MEDINQQVLLLHGLGRSPRSMHKLQKALQDSNYKVINAGYLGVLGDYKQILAQLTGKILAEIDPNQPLHFVGHSFGGLLIRGLLAQDNNWKLARCVMLGTPNQGTNTAAYMSSHAILKHFTPKVARQLAPGSELIRTLPEPSIETGIIAGNRSRSILVPVTWFYNRATDNAPGDGVVEISNTRCCNMSDFIELPLHHSFMMWDSQLIEQTIHFLKNGQFRR